MISRTDITFTDEQRVTAVLTALGQAEHELGIHGSVDDPWHERAKRILYAARRNPILEARLYRLCWLLLH